MPLFRRRPRSVPAPSPLVRPSLDGGGWPDADAAPSFEVRTTWELAQRRAVEPDAHGVAERLVDALAPHLGVEVAPEDAPHLHKTLVTAARLGAGVALLHPEPADAVDRTAAGALWEARRSLPRTQRDLASYFLLAGHWAARSDTSPHATAVAQLVADVERPRPPG